MPRRLWFPIVLAAALVFGCNHPTSDSEHQFVIFERAVNGIADLYAIRDDGTGLTVLSNAPGDEQFIGITPAGRVIFSLFDGNDHESRTDLYSVNADGTDPLVGAQSTDGEVYIDPHIGRMGTVFFRRLKGLEADIYAINLDGTGLVVLANSSDDESIVGLY